jgi:hypothetical protein
VVSYSFEMAESEAEQMAERAHALGYSTITDYVQALVAADMLVAQLRPDWEDADEPTAEIEASFREAWHEAMTGRTLPIERLWDELADDE